MSLEGILPLYKPRGMTSHDCIFKLRKILQTRKIGHTGTLDPEVDGVLPLCIGRATKVAEYLTEADKMYEGEVTIGISTMTEDQTGEVVEKRKITTEITRQQILSVLKSLTGTITQVPPMYSAVKVKGKRLYEYAREGLEVERPSRTVEIYSIQLLDEKQSYGGETISFPFRVHCSKGTYVRTLAVMIGEKLGYPAHMSKLTRVKSGNFQLENCIAFEEVIELYDKQKLHTKILPLEMALSHLPKYTINDKVTEKVKNGAILTIPDKLKPMDNQVVLQTANGTAIAIYIKHPEKQTLMKPQKVLRNDFLVEKR